MSSSVVIKRTLKFKFKFKLKHVGLTSKKK